MALHRPPSLTPCVAGMSVGVALPAFLFEKGAAAPFVLAAIVGAFLARSLWPPPG